MDREILTVSRNRHMLIELKSFFVDVNGEVHFQAVFSQLKRIMEIPKHFHGAVTFGNTFYMVNFITVCWPLLFLFPSVLVLLSNWNTSARRATARSGKPPPWFPLGELVEQWPSSQSMDPPLKFEFLF